jgi:Ni,Fe-hydrogenase III large subunit
MFQHANGFAHDFRTDSITRNNCDSFHQVLVRHAEHGHSRAAYDFLGS